MNNYEFEIPDSNTRTKSGDTMIKATAIEKAHLICDTCGQIIEKCEKCKGNFYAGEKMVCLLDNHYHTSCFLNRWVENENR